MSEGIWQEKCIIAPSLICLDMLHLEQQVRELEQSGIKMLHVDIIDGHFSPSMPLGFEAVKQLRSITDMPFDCHIMAEQPEYFIDELLNTGVQQITFHEEAAPHADRLINQIHAAGVRAGLALKPATPLSVLEYEIEKCDAIVLMLINPGYASHKGEARVPYGDRKIRELRRMIDERKLNTKISIDGRVSFADMREYGKDIVDIFVGGTTCIARSDIAGSVKKVMQVRHELLEG